MMRGAIIPASTGRILRLDSLDVKPAAALTLANTDVRTVTQGIIQLQEMWGDLTEIGSVSISSPEKGTRYVRNPNQFLARFFSGNRAFDIRADCRTSMCNSIVGNKIIFLLIPVTVTNLSGGCF